MGSLALAYAFALCTSANAFVPTPLQKLTTPARHSSPLQMVAEDVPTFAKDDAGITLPFGYFDPLGLAKDEDTFKFYRRGEIKNGRTAMLAVIGYAVPYFFKFDGWLASDPELKFADIPAGVEAMKAISGAGIIQLMFFIAFLDNIVFPVGTTAYGGEMDIGPGFWYKGPEDPEQFKALQAREINNGRLAMFSIIGLLVQDLISDAPFPFTTK